MEIFFKNPKLYFIGGNARHGKTTFASFIKNEYEKNNKKVAILHYSKYIKEYAKDYFGWNGKEETKPRDLLQMLGTDIIRKKLNKKLFFINRLHEDIDILSYFFDILIIDDLRLKLEIEYARKKFKNAVIIKIIRENFDNKLTLEQKKDLTEVNLDNYLNFDYIIKNDGTINDLYKEGLKIINQEEGIENEV